MNLFAIANTTNSINKNINEGSFEIDYTVSPNDAYRDVEDGGTIKVVESIVSEAVLPEYSFLQGIHY